MRTPAGRILDEQLAEEGERKKGVQWPPSWKCKGGLSGMQGNSGPALNHAGAMRWRPWLIEAGKWQPFCQLSNEVMPYFLPRLFSFSVWLPFPAIFPFSSSNVMWMSAQPPSFNERDQTNQALPEGKPVSWRIRHAGRRPWEKGSKHEGARGRPQCSTPLRTDVAGRVHTFLFLQKKIAGGISLTAGVEQNHNYVSKCLHGIPSCGVLRSGVCMKRGGEGGREWPRQHAREKRIVVIGM